MNILLLLSLAGLISSTPISSTFAHQKIATNSHREYKVLAAHVRAPVVPTSLITRQNRRTNAPSAATTTPTTPAPVPVVTPPSTLPPTPPPSTGVGSDVASQIEGMIVSLSNTERQKNGLAPLIADPALAQIARAHSADMLAHQYFSHTDLSGCGLSCRFAAAGYSYWSIGENIHMMSGYNFTPSESAQKIVSDWMNSPGHRANILNTSFTRTGVGVALQGSTVYSTTDFSLPR